MNLIPWRNKREHKESNPAHQHPIARLRDEMDHAFEQFWRDPWDAGFGLRLNLAESDNEVTVTAELPGVDPKHIDLDVSGNTLTIRGEKKEETENKRRNYHYVERSYGSFHRSIQLPSSADTSKIDAKCRDGVLTITLPKREEATPKRITVQHE